MQPAVMLRNPEGRGGLDVRRLGLIRQMVSVMLAVLSHSRVIGMPGKGSHGEHQPASDHCRIRPRRNT